MAELSISDFLEPIGQLEPDVLWPGRRRWPRTRIEAAVEEYRKQGYLQTAGIADWDRRNAIVTWWVYFRAWSAFHGRLSGSPASVNAVLEGGSSYTQAQIDSWGDKAAEARANYEGMLLAVTAPVLVQRSSRCSESQVRF